MNADKWEWLHNANMIFPTMLTSDSDDDARQFTEDSLALATAIEKTRRAIQLGIALAAIDGPLPFMDVVGFGVTSALAGYAWYEYFS